nr:polysaccharide pyruvyl transferase family protein [Tenacibaculum mesophilum]
MNLIRLEDIKKTFIDFVKLIISFTGVYRFRYVKSDKELEFERKYVGEFINNYINSTERVYSTSGLLKLQQENSFEAYVVGSDQVWRPKYSPNIFNYFLDFLYFKTNVRKVGYAISYGSDKWEFTPDETKKCKSLVQRFDALSVRENTAVSLTNDNLNVRCTHVVDPTMLLNKEDYLELIKSKPKSIKKFFFVYILDRKKELIDVVNQISKEKKLTPLYISHVGDGKKPVPYIEDWLAAFRDCEFVVTDSFHGTVFSILFEKQFLSIGNKDRGLSRFNSILNMLGLSKRLFVQVNNEAMLNVLNENVNFEEVNRSLNEQRVKSIEFLKQSLTF